MTSQFKKIGWKGPGMCTYVALLRELLDGTLRLGTGDCRNLPGRPTEVRQVVIPQANFKMNILGGRD